MDISERIKQKIAKKLQNWKEIVAKEQIEQHEEELWINCLWI